MVNINKIAVLGPIGTFSDIAARKLGFERVYFNTHDEVFAVISDCRTDFALVAFENQLTGTIMENLDAIIKNNLVIIKEIMIPVHHNLCVLPQVKGLNEIKTIYSHHQGLMQCKAFLSGLKVKHVAAESTVSGFEKIKTGNFSDAACIGTKLAAEIYGLNILSANIEDFHHNQTRFFVLGKKGTEDDAKNANKTSIIFTIKHEPGSLVSCLQRLARYDVNLTKIDSMPIPEKPWEYMFYCELESKDEGKLKIALSEMEVTSSFFRNLGNYEVIKESDTDENN